MEIESVKVILSRKETKWEDFKHKFEVAGITTSYDEWEKNNLKYINEYLNAKFSDVFTEECVDFAKSQHAYMTSPTALFGGDCFVVKFMKVKSLDGIILDGPLYIIHTIDVEDIDAGKTVERAYKNPDNFQEEFGLWYPKIKMFNIRYGVAIK
jgi:hypothetical protein